MTEPRIDVEEPGPGQESVWQYPRPPAVEPTDEHVVVEVDGDRTLADTTGALRVLETSHPPGYYVPREDVDTSLLERNPERSSICEFKGVATYWDLVVDGERTEAVGWSYEAPREGFEELTGHLTFYPERVGRCLVDDEEVRPQEGQFYGGWVTDRVVGPFKGAPGTLHW